MQRNRSNVIINPVNDLDHSGRATHDEKLVFFLLDSFEILAHFGSGPNGAECKIIYRVVDYVANIFLIRTYVSIRSFRSGWFLTFVSFCLFY
jgi:hypothetical protein